MSLTMTYLPDSRPKLFEIVEWIKKGRYSPTKIFRLDLPDFTSVTFKKKEINQHIDKIHKYAYATCYQIRIVDAVRYKGDIYSHEKAFIFYDMDAYADAMKKAKQDFIQSQIEKFDE